MGNCVKLPILLSIMHRLAGSLASRDTDTSSIAAPTVRLANNVITW